MEKLEKRSEVTDANIPNRIQAIEDRISGIEDTTVNENAKWKTLQTENIQEIEDTLKKPNLRIIGTEESKDFQVNV